MEDVMRPNSFTPLPPSCPPTTGDVWRRATLVCQIVAHLFEVPVEDLQSRTRRNASAALARQVAMYVCHVSLGLSFSDVGGLFARDRTTASHACKVIELRRDERDFDEFLKRIEEAVSALGATPQPAYPAFGCGCRA